MLNFVNDYCNAHHLNDMNNCTALTNRDKARLYFRHATTADIRRISEIYEAIHTEEEAGRITTGWLRGTYPVESTAVAALERGDLYVGEINGAVVGSAIFNKVQPDCYAGNAWEADCPEDRVFVMHTLVIDPAVAGKGYGKAFEAYYEQLARENGCEVLRLDTQAKNTRARAMYKNCGFREVGIVPCVFCGIPDVSLVLLEKSADKVYYADELLRIRDLKPADAKPLTDEEVAQGWHTTADKFLHRMEDQKSGKSISLVAEYGGQPVGYINVYPDASGGAFGKQGYPEIVDFAVLEKFRNRGIGSKLMDIAEQIAKQYADMVYLGVGLHKGYGSAQRMYVKRGYIPDGSGVWYGDKPCPPYGETVNDDDLNLYLSKRL